MLNKTWYKSRRGGRDATAEKDCPGGRNRNEKGRKESKQEEEVGKKEAGMVKVVEAVVFVPFTTGSVLKNLLQKIDDCLTGSLGSPAVRFLERGGSTIVDLLGKSNPWAKEAACGREGCLPCWGRAWLYSEKGRNGRSKAGR